MNEPGMGAGEGTAPDELRGTRALVVDDDPLVVALVRRALEAAGADVESIDRGDDVVPRVAGGGFDAVLLDLDLPGADGLDVLSRVRRSSNVPVLVITASGDEQSAVRALRAGADEYMRKPLAPDLVVACTAAVIRRSAAPAPPANIYADRLLEIDFERAEVRVSGDVVRLRPLEYKLLVALVEHRGQALDGRQLLRHVWADGRGDATNVKSLVSNLRTRLAVGDAGGSSPIETVRGVGYRYRARGQ